MLGLKRKGDGPLVRICKKNDEKKIYKANLEGYRGHKRTRLTFRDRMGHALSGKKLGKSLSEIGERV